jgi:hypothetical protein
LFIEVLNFTATAGFTAETADIAGQENKISLATNKRESTRIAKQKK